MTTLLIDNFDSFTWNVFQSLSQANAQVVVRRNNEISLSEAIKLSPKNLVISPGKIKIYNILKTLERFSLGCDIGYHIVIIQDIIITCNNNTIIYI
jgi:anthranilate/para-aminobenzoate synthase component II